MCGNNGFCGGNIWWIIILVLLFCCCGGHDCGCERNNGGNGCGCYYARPVRMKITPGPWPRGFCASRLLRDPGLSVYFAQGG